ncbi:MULTISPECIES: phosphotransferase [Arthrobacter]|uniref:Maltokinase n=2 Tax=Arthrobacter TaxID=1663 RepID=A0ABU9KJB8_9MICC|nr:phosphotransferase [Arthrobacter sp. YJM1]MDP5226702.1 phosphotransferase [Arthrobacter sp. YJM1]
MISRTEALTELLEGWLPQQRWFPAKGRDTRLVPVSVTPCDLGQGLHGEFRLFRLASGGAVEPVVLQVPLLFSPHTGGTDPAGPLHAGFIGTIPGDMAGEEWDVFDGPKRREFVEAVLSLMAGDGILRTGRGSGVVGRTAAGGRTFLETLTRPLSLESIRGEQSNSSVIANPGPGGTILKFFRTLFPGRNPEVELGEALTRLGTQDVPSTVGWLQAEWGEDRGTVRTDLAVTHEFLPGGRDAWAAAVLSAAEGSSFARQAHAIGQGTARIHRRLAEGLPAASAGDAQGVLDRLAERIRESWAQARAVVGPYDVQIERLLASLTTVPTHPQRIHGDLHLGQILSVDSPAGAGDRWIFLDFEGEPLRPAVERSLPDLPLRDVVGLLRSFDYAAGAAHRQAPDAVVPGGWVADCSEAFLEGYSSVVPGRIDQRSPLFMALWLDKALYEVRYEQNNRPEWLEIPALAARSALEELSGPEVKGNP